MRMRQIFTASFMLLLITMCVEAQPREQQERRRMDPQEFQRRARQEMTRVAEFTSDEETVFFELYTEMREKQRQMGQQVHELKKKEATADNIMKIKKLQVEMAELEQSYYKRILKVIPPEKVWRVMKAEDEFHRRMVRGKRREGKEKGR